LKNILQSNSIKHVYFTDKEYYSLKYFKLRTWGIKRIIIHDHKPGERPYVFGIKRILKNTIHRLGIFSADLYIGVSYFVYLRMLNNACLPPNLCAYVLNGIQPIEIKKEDEKYVNKTFHLPDSALNGWYVWKCQEENTSPPLFEKGLIERKLNPGFEEAEHFDDGRSCWYTRVGYRMTYFRRGAASLYFGGDYDSLSRSRGFSVPWLHLLYKPGRCIFKFRPLFVQLLCQWPR